ncbi:MAG: LAGLIDADG family homing endonuclease [Pyrinomonadaceae bacterium]
MFRLQRLEITGFKSFVDHTELIFTGDGTTAIVGPNGCGKCVSGDTLVTLADGREVAIRELVDNSLSRSSEIEVLDDGLVTRQNPQAIRILSLHPETLRLEPRPVSAFIKREATPYLLRIRTRAGREVTATPYHPLFTLDRGRLRSLKAEELQAGVRIAVPRRLPVSGAAVPIRPHQVLAELREEDNIYVANSAAMRSWASDNRAIFGTWRNWMRAADVPASRFRGLPGGQAVGATTLAQLARAATIQPPLDGRFQSERAGVMRLPPTFTPDLARFLGLLVAEGRNTVSNQTWFVNSDPAVNNEYARLAETQLGLEVHRYKYKVGVEDSLIYSRALGVMLERLFNYPVGSRSAEKEVPAQIFCSDEETQWAFLSGLFEGDAYVCARPQSGQRRPLAYIEYVSASQKLAQGVISLLLRLGIFAVLRRKERYASNTPERRRRPYYSVLIYGIEQLQRTAARLSFIGEKQRALEAIKAIRPASNPNHDLVPGVTSLVKEAARVAGVKMKRHRRQHPKLAAYVENRCEASRGGLLEVAAQIEKLGSETDAARHTLDHLTVLATSDLYWDEIVSIEQVPPADPWVYDLSVAETHNFVAGNIVVHNSNISDAISWVLGEQKAKQLRGSEMKDVIFQGSRNRPPAGMAEVVLHLVRDETMPTDSDVEDLDSALEDIDEHVVPIAGEQEKAAGGDPGPLAEASAAEPVKDAAELEAAARKRGRRHWRPSRVALEFPPGETVTVARRLYRSGESEYLLNGRECRLRDIQDLFSGTGLSGAHYAIIEQGRIGQILSAKPMERRALIEEAAGITKFRVRQRAAEARLESARANLRRLTDITLEIERQVGSLRRQAAKRRYRAVREELRDLLRDVFVAEEQALSHLLAATRERLAEAEAAELSLGEILVALQDEAREATAAARLCEEQLSVARARAAECALQRDRRERECAYLREQAANLERRTGELETELKALRARRRSRSRVRSSARAGSRVARRQRRSHANACRLRGSLQSTITRSGRRRVVNRERSRRAADAHRRSRAINGARPAARRGLRSIDAAGRRFSARRRARTRSARGRAA